MFKRSMLVMSAISMIAVPAVADAHHYSGYDDNYAYGEQGYYPQQGYAQQGYYPQQAYGYGNGYYGRSYDYRRHRCSGTTGTIVGAGAGALLGRSLGRGKRLLPPEQWDDWYHPWRSTWRACRTRGWQVNVLSRKSPE